MKHCECGLPITQYVCLPCERLNRKAFKMLGKPDKPKREPRNIDALPDLTQEYKLSLH